MPKVLRLMPERSKVGRNNGPDCYVYVSPVRSFAGACLFSVIVRVFLNSLLDLDVLWSRTISDGSVRLSIHKP